MEQNMTSSASLPIPCLAGRPLQGRQLSVSVPGSKSITNRALLLATLARGKSTLQGVLFSEDSRNFLKCIQELGIETAVDEPGRRITVCGQGGTLPVSAASIHVGSAGTAARFLTAYLGIKEGTWHMDASAQMRKRPMAPLMESLAALGCETVYHERPGFFPFTLKGHGFGVSDIRVNIDSSSQFLSALLIASCLSDRPFSIHVEGAHGTAYIDMTLRMMEQFGVKASRITGQAEGTVFTIQPGQAYHAMDYRIEPDVSGACYFYALAALLGISVTVAHVTDASMQGDIRFLDLLTRMGCARRDTPGGICITGPEGGRLKGIAADMSSCSDQAVTLAAIAPFADSPTVITGIGHIRYQESDRIHGIVTELNKMGIRCEETRDSITIHPGSPKGCAIDTYDDHRMAMGFALTGLRAPGISINDPSCCRKTFENYFDVLSACIAECR